MSEEQEPVIVVRKIKRVSGGHHGGAWKVAYADFVTAMMAFFLVMWILGQGTRQQKAAISEYFKNPSMEQGQATMAPPGQMGPGGASDSMIKMGGAMDIPKGPGNERRYAKAPTSKEDLEKLAKAQEKARLEDLMKQLNAAIQNSQALAPFKDQLLLDITSEGLRIQIVDKQNRPMFDLGSARLKDYTVDILHELATFINKVPNPISISGHTDDAPYSNNHNYSNWELSADRANAARRALLEGGLQEGKIARVVGLADSVPFDRKDPGAAINRRISIIVMTHEAAEAAKLPEAADAAPAASSSAPAAVAAAPVPAGSVSAPTVTGAASAAGKAPSPAPASPLAGMATPAAQTLPPLPATVHIVHPNGTPAAVQAVQAAGFPVGASSSRLP
ncbi:MAG: flagellar motor protein MotB [Xanthomonadaceae bacterium]|nr:flagellar motor protein MotB [Xanthomonadaceae bacterium]MDE1962726.1 flagellar motor protein MotB [Xanthomonadaceae bacterium]